MGDGFEWQGGYAVGDDGGGCSRRNAVAHGEAMSEQQLLAAARAGDEDAFARLIAPYGRELHAHC